MYDFYRVEKFWLEKDYTCNHEPDSWDYDSLKEAVKKFDSIDVREEFLRERKQYWNPSKFNKTLCATIYGIIVDDDGYEEYHEIGDNNMIEYGFEDYQKEEAMKYLYDVYNDYDKKVDFKAASDMMDEIIVKKLKDDNWFTTNQEFFDAYCEAHLEKFGEVFEPNRY